MEVRHRVSTEPYWMSNTDKLVRLTGGGGHLTVENERSIAGEGGTFEIIH